jgi:hypothetical protein
MATLDELINAIFEGKRTPLSREFEGWVRESRRYRAFAETYQVKIRAKLRRVGDEGGMQDLRTELETAALLLREERFAVEYEKYAALKQRGPDFTVTYRTHTPFNVEVRRIRGVEMDDGAGADTRGFKLMAVLCDKVGQMPPSIINLLWLTAERKMTEADVNDALRALRQLAEQKNEDFFTRRGFESAADFVRRQRHLSGIVLRQAGPNVVLPNTLAKHKVLPEIVTAVERV